LVNLLELDIYIKLYFFYTIFCYALPHFLTVSRFFIDVTSYPPPHAFWSR